jgi:hypothetical protein
LIYGNLGINDTNLKTYLKMVKDKMTYEGFNEEFENTLRRCKSLKQAYELVEEEHERKYGERKYSGYNSFRNVRGGRIKKG